MKKLIVIASGKGGAGKTTTAINLAAAINHFGGDVLIVDANMMTPNVGIHLNSPEVPISLNHVLNRKAKVSEAIYEHASGVKVMPSSLSVRELKNIRIEKLKNLKKDLKKVADYVIVDCAAGLGKEALEVIKIADEVILITNPEMPALTDALKTIKVSEEEKIPLLGVIVTRVRRNNAEMSPLDVRSILDSEILGMIPEDNTVQRALSERDALVHTYPKSKAARAYKEIAANLIGVPYDSDSDRERFWVRIFRR